ncbi:MAG: ComEC/Rec2 family competence protein [Bacteroidota bacterium]
MHNQPFSKAPGHIPFIRITLFFMSGIYIGQSIPLAYYPHIASLLLLLVGIYLCCFILRKKKPILHHTTLLLPLPLICFFIAGALHLLQQSPHIQSHHIIHTAAETTAYKGIVAKDITVRDRQKEVIIQVTHIQRHDQWQSAVGKVRLLLPKKQLKNLMYGDYLLIKGKPSLFAKPTNPQVVNYNQQWTIQHIFHTHTTKACQIIGHQPPSQVVKYTLRLRNYCAQQLQHYIKDKTAIGITLALLLGIRTHLQQQTREIYTISGVMHILAVSGLHVGLLYTLLLYILYLLSSFLFRKPKKYPLITLFFIWIYAFIVQLTPSVLRAVSLLSLIVIAKKQQKSYHTINLLSLIAFLLLLYNPHFLLDIGFQLSFTAVLSLTLLYQPLHKLYTPTRKPLTYLWSITAGSLAVQVGTLPISLYYFQYFPTYFLLANYIMLPLAAPILLLAITSLLFSWWPSAAAALAFSLDHILQVTTTLLARLTRLPYAQLGPFQLALWQIVLYYTLLASSYLIIKHRQLRYILMSAASLATLNGVTFYHYLQQKQQKKIIVYDTGKRHVIAFIAGQQATLLTNKTLQPYEATYRYQILPSLNHAGLYHITQQNTQHVKKSLLYQWQGKSILIIDKNHTLPEKLPPRIDILIVQDNTTLLPPALDCPIGILIIGADHPQPKTLAQQATQRNIQYYSILDKGAWVYNAT